LPDEFDVTDMSHRDVLDRTLAKHKKHKEDTLFIYLVDTYDVAGTLQ